MAEVAQEVTFDSSGRGTLFWTSPEKLDNESVLKRKGHKTKRTGMIVPGGRAAKSRGELVAQSRGGRLASADARVHMAFIIIVDRECGIPVS
jgi:hypothetical protein